MRNREPKDETLVAARIARAYPSISPYAAASLAVELCAIERAQRRHAERCCSGLDGGYVKSRPATGQWKGGTTWEHDPDAEARAEKRIERRILKWHGKLAELVWIAAGKDHHGVPSYTMLAACPSVAITLQGDPRGPVLLLQLPGEPEPKAV